MTHINGFSSAPTVIDRRYNPSIAGIHTLILRLVS